MVKTTVYLDDDVALSLRAIAERRDKPQAELIREALRSYTSREKPPLPAGMGKFSSGRSDISATYRKLLRKAARDRRWP